MTGARGRGAFQGHGVIAAALVVQVALVAACGRGERGADAVRKPCGVNAGTVLSDSGIGALRIGASADSLHGVCEVLSDVTLEQGNEGMPERRMTVVVGSVSTTATIADGRVWRIEVASPRFRTADSLGVGSTMADLRHSTARLLTGDRGAFVVRRDHCGLSFQLADTPVSAKLPEIPDSTRVSLVLIVGCG